MAVAVLLATLHATTAQAQQQVPASPAAVANKAAPVKGLPQNDLDDLSLEELLELRSSILEVKQNLTYYIEETDDSSDDDDDSNGEIETQELDQEPSSHVMSPELAEPES